MSDTIIPHNVPVEKGGDENSNSSTRTWGQFWRKYFLQGQQLDDHSSSAVHPSPPPNGHHPHQLSSSSPSSPLSFADRYRKYIGFAAPFVFMHLVWWSLAIRHNLFRLYPTRYPLAITMLVGATVGGATSEGGGAVAFPVMTLLLHIGPVVARDFSLMIQSTGMTSAAFTILWMRILVEWHSVVFCTFGATFGIVLGLQFVDDLFDGPTKKMLFVSVWFSFAIALFLLNRQRKRIAHLSIQNFGPCKAVVLVFTGFVGGLCSAFAGSGVDICSFSILTLLFKVSEKIATPTSVLLMAANTLNPVIIPSFPFLVGFFWRQLIQEGISTDAWEYFAVSVPVVVICGPLGAFLSSHLHRQVLAVMIYVLEAMALVGFLITQPPLRLVAISGAIMVFSFFFFSALIRMGNWMDRQQKTDHDQSGPGNGQNGTICWTTPFALPKHSTETEGKMTKGAVPPDQSRDG